MNIKRLAAALIGVAAPILAIGQAPEVASKHLDVLEYEGQIREAYEYTNALMLKNQDTGDAALYAMALTRHLRYAGQLNDIDVNQMLELLRNRAAVAPAGARPVVLLLEASFLAEYRSDNSYEVNRRVASGDGKDKSLEAMSNEDFRLSIQRLSYAAIEAAKSVDQEAVLFKSLYSGDGYMVGYYPRLLDLVYFQAASLAMQFTESQVVAAELYNSPASNASDALAVMLGYYDDWIAASADFPATAGHAALLRTLALKEIDAGRNAATNLVGRLESLAVQYAGTAVADDIRLALAEEYKGMSEQHVVGDDEWEQYRDYQAKALQMLGELTKSQEKAIALRASALVKEITKPEFALFCNPNETAESNFAVAVRYANVKSVTLSLKKLRTSDAWTPGDDLSHRYAKATPVWKADIELPQSGDHYARTTRVVVPFGTAGIYLLEARIDGPKGNVVASEMVNISRLAVYSQQGEGNATEVCLVDRMSGKNVRAGKILIYDSDYDRTLRKRVWKVLRESEVKDGVATFASADLARTSYLAAVADGDTLWCRGSMSMGVRGEPRPAKYVRLVTDRPIYRPGQQIEVKGFAFDVANGQAQACQTSGELSARDANGNEIARYSFTTNEFGSFALSVEIPGDILPGQLTLSTGNGSRAVRVESHRRYSFDGQFVDPDRAVAPGAEAEIVFRAAAYSGVDLSRLRVRGEVTVDRRWSWRSPQGRTVAKIDTVAAPDGTVRIRFVADDVDMQNYTIRLTATTSTGESREFSHSYTVAAVPYTVAVSRPRMLLDGEPARVAVEQPNRGGSADRLRMRLLKLQDPARGLVAGDLPAPDVHLYTPQQWGKLIPGVAYENELNANTLSPEREIWSAEDAPGKLSIPADVYASLEAGIYRVELWNGAKASQAHFTVADAKSKRNPETEPLAIYTEKSSTTVGEVVNVVISSSLNDARITYNISSGGRVALRGCQVARNGKLALQVPVDAEGGIHVNAVVVTAGVSASAAERIDVDARSRRIDVAFESIREQLEPGARETWTLRLSAPDGRPLDAEAMVWMYDASLDAFAPAQDLDIWNHATAPNAGAMRLPNLGARASHLSSYVDVPGMPHPPMWLFEGVASVDGGYDGLAITAPPGPGSAPANVQPARKLGMSRAEIGDDDEGDDDAVAAGGTPADEQHADADIAPRTNLRETAFFFPQLRPAADGSLVVTFEVPEALTRWRVQALAHDKMLATGTARAMVVTSKSLMVQPLFPRLLYTGDKAVVTAVVFNQGDSALVVEPRAEAYDTRTRETVSVSIPGGAFTVEPGREATFDVVVDAPSSPGFVTLKITGQSGNVGDGEQRVIPVHPDHMRVANAVALWGKPLGTTTYKFDGLVPAGARGAQVTLEMSTNPAWYAVQSLPRFDNPDTRCALMLSAALYAARVGASVVKRHPEAARNIALWAQAEPDALTSELERSPELKITEIEKTPWYNDAVDDSRHKRQLAKFLDVNHIANLTSTSADWLAERQLPSGGFAWRPGGPESPFITMAVMDNLARILPVEPRFFSENYKLRELANNAMAYLDGVLNEMHRQALSSPDTAKYQTPYYAIWVLNISRLLDNKRALGSEAREFLYRHAASNINYYNLYGKAMIGLIANAVGDIKSSNAILKSLDGSAVVDAQKGVFWRENIGGWEWYQSTLATQAQCIEFYVAMGAPVERVDAMKIWLLQQKRAGRWENSVVTADVVWAMLAGGSDWLSADAGVTVTLGNLAIESGDYAQHAGTGYFKATLPVEAGGADQVSVANPNPGPVYGGLHATFYQRFEDIEPWQRELTVACDIIPAETGYPAAKGDKVTARLTVKSDRQLDYVVAVLPLPSCAEPVDQLGGWRADGCYTQIFDDRIEFYFWTLPQGVSVLDTELYLLREGDYGAAPASVQSLYAPEFGARAAGSRWEIGR